MSNYFADRWATVLKNGLYGSKGEPFFSWYGCHVCGESGTVEEIEGYENLELSKAGKNNLVNFQVCGDCLLNHT